MSGWLFLLIIIADNKHYKNKMKTNELRIGNYVETPGGSIEIVRGVLNDLQVNTSKEGDKISLTHRVDYINPIPLTEEWLKRFYECGVVVCDAKIGVSNEYHIDIDDNLYIRIFNDMTFRIQNIHSGDIYILIYDDFLESVHYLQNLYNLLTKGKELTIKK